MNLETLFNTYREDNRLKELADRIAMPGSAHLSLQGLTGASSALLAGAVWSHLDYNHVFILNDKEEAAYFQNDLENILHALDIFYFPDSFKKSGFFDVMNGSHLMLRTEALMKLTGDQVRKKILVTYPEAVFEKVIRPQAFSSAMIQIKSGDELHLDALLGRLIQAGFERSDFVYEPGQFAMRGGILDIYSFGNDKPYRVELFGNEVDSIRIFDPETQLSERKLLQVTLIPNMKIRGGRSDKTSLFEFLPARTVWWVSNQTFLLETLEALEEKLHHFLNSSDAGTTQVKEPVFQEEQQAVPLSPEDFNTSEAVRDWLKERKVIEFGESSKQQGPESETFRYNTAPQPVFNRRFDLLIADLKKYVTEGYSLYIFSENPKQLNRINAIFEDLREDIPFYSVPVAISQGFIDHDHRWVCYTDHQIFQRYHKYRVKQAYNKNKALTLKTLRELQPGDFVTHIDHGVGVYSGLEKIETNGHVQEAVRILYKDHDILYVNINSLHKISKYSGKEGVAPRVNKLGSDAWNKLKEKTKSKVKDIAKDLIKLYAARKAEKGFAHSPDTYLQTELEASFIFEDTPDQSKATLDVKKDMESESPMDRLVCGDVGFGKTEVAVRAAFKSVADSKQAAILVPTTILAYQHYQTFSERLQDFPCTVDFINRFKSAREKKETIQKLKEGKIDIIVGTHSLLGKDIKFRDLGVLIVDEEQKFGVSAKEKLKQLKVNVDTLTLTATPIPRTLQFSLMGARDLSIINTPPPNRQPIQTEVHVFNEDLIREAIYFEAERGGQVFFIHNRVQSIREMAGIIQGLCPDLEVAHAHGKMEGDQLEKTILDFINHRYDVLVCTNIVESGVDIPNANTIIINNAHHFGLSDLHQLRGRVGRSNKKAFCYLLAPPMSTLSTESRKRLQTLEQHSELGSGFQIAMRDLDIRGAGNLLGSEQSGFIAEIGFDMYHKILDESIRELKQTEFKDLFKQQLEEKQEFISDCTLDTDQEILIPDEYVESITERLSLYQQLDNLDTDQQLDDFRKELTDRFGPVPPQTDALFSALRCRKIAMKIGFEKIILKNNKARCYFISNPDSAYFESDLFQHVLHFIQTEVNNIRLKQVGKNFMLVIEQINNMKDLEGLLFRMLPKQKLTDKGKKPTESLSHSQ
jgi:transcription-repair coupling factor (superfamily II helicase)